MSNFRFDVNRSIAKMLSIFRQSIVDVLSSISRAGTSSLSPVAMFNPVDSSINVSGDLTTPNRFSFKTCQHSKLSQFFSHRKLQHTTWKCSIANGKHAGENKAIGSRSSRGTIDDGTEKSSNVDKRIKKWRKSNKDDIFVGKSVNANQQMMSHYAAAAPTKKLPWRVWRPRR